MKKVYAYYRVSTQTQAELNGIEMQVAEVEKYCKLNGIEITGSFEDEGISGTIVEREGITELLSVLEKGDKVVVQNTSRLWRDYFAHAMIRHEIEKIGADVLSVEQPTYSVKDKDPNDMLFNGLMELLDRYEKMSISVKLAKGRKARAKSGHKPCGAAPLGYRWEENRVVIDYNSNLIVKDIFDKYVELKSLGKLKDYCDEAGYLTLNGKHFSKQALKNIIENDFYVGVVTYAGKKVSGEHEALIENNIFEEANKILKR